MTLIIKEATAEDVAKFEYDGLEAEILEKIDWRGQLGQFVALGPSWIVTHQRQALTIAGFYQISPGVVQAWMLFNRNARAYARPLVDEIRKKLDLAFEAGAHRIQTYVVEGQEKAENYVKRLGFIQEGIMEAFGPGRENMIVYKILKVKS